MVTTSSSAGTLLAVVTATVKVAVAPGWLGVTHGDWPAKVSRGSSPPAVAPVVAPLEPEMPAASPATPAAEAGARATPAAEAGPRGTTAVAEPAATTAKTAASASTAGPEDRAHLVDTGATLTGDSSSSTAALPWAGADRPGARAVPNPGGCHQ